MPDVDKSGDWVFADGTVDLDTALQSAMGGFTFNNPEDGKRANEVKQKYNAQCGTPFFIDAETGNQVCGFREKDVLQKWVDGEEIPQPPKPKSPPPPPPQDIESASDEEINTWKEGYEKWSKENDHLPNILPFDQIKERIKQAQIQRKLNPQGAPGQPSQAPAAPKQVGDHVVNVNDQFYYVVINGVRETVFAEKSFISSLSQQYFWRESDGKLSKVVGDTNFNKKPTPQPQPNKPNVSVKPPNKEVQKQIDSIKQKQDSKKKDTNKKSKKNTKKIAGI